MGVGAAVLCWESVQVWTEKVKFEQKHEGSEGVAIWMQSGRKFQAQETARININNYKQKNK